MSNWVSKQINASRKISRMFFFTISPLLALLGALGLLVVLVMRFEGLDLLDSAEKIERFSGSGSFGTRLAYTEAYDTYSTFDIETTVNQLGDLGDGVPGPLSEPGITSVTYHAWYLKGADYSVVYATPGDAPVTAPGTLYVANDAPELDDEVRQMYAPDASNVYVFYESEDMISEIYSGAAYVLSVALLMLLFACVPFFQRFTRMGRHIATLGDYRTVREDINRQSGQPLFQSSYCLILDDYTLLRKLRFVSRRDAPHFYRNADLEQCMITRDIEQARGGGAIYNVSLRFAGMTDLYSFRISEAKKLALEEAITRIRPTTITTGL